MSPPLPLPRAALSVCIPCRVRLLACLRRRLSSSASVPSSAFASSSTFAPPCRSSTSVQSVQSVRAAGTASTVRRTERREAARRREDAQRRKAALEGIYLPLPPRARTGVPPSTGPVTPRAGHEAPARTRTGLPPRAGPALPVQPMSAPLNAGSRRLNGTLVHGSRRQSGGLLNHFSSSAVGGKDPMENAAEEDGRSSLEEKQLLGREEELHAQPTSRENHIAELEDEAGVYIEELEELEGLQRGIDLEQRIIRDLDAEDGIEDVTAEVVDVESQDYDAAEQTPTAEEVVAGVRRRFGDRLPEGALNEEQYKIYKRLYGPPFVDTRPMSGFKEEPDVLLREADDGSLEEVEFWPPEESEEVEAEMLEHVMDLPEMEMEIVEELEHETPAEVVYGPQPSRRQEQATEQLQRDIEEAMASQATDLQAKEVEASTADADEHEADGEDHRAHPFTVPNRFATFPSTITLPVETFVRPISAMLADLPNKHLDQTASRVFGGPGLPYSTGTPLSSRNKPQLPTPITASQAKMKDMEANAFMAAIMPGHYAALTGILVEVRKRLGTQWIENLLTKEGGPRILDAGAGGAGVLAWRDVLRAEWSRMHDDASDEHQHSAPLGKATVLTGSDALRERVSFLLGNTTFIPRLPDYVHSSLPEDSRRKQFDIIVAPYSLWHIQESHERKQKLLTLWSLLDSKAGVLVLLEKGVPRGFEVIASAREYLTENLFERPATVAPLTDEPGEQESVSEDQNPSLEDQHDAPNQRTASAATLSRLSRQLRGPARLVAPCPHHAACPMYVPHSGESRQRKDYCHFSQRYIRPPFHQRLLKARERNHEDVHFSYIAAQKGVAPPEDILQGDDADARAFEGYEVDDPDITHAPSTTNPGDSMPVPPRNPLPRTVLPPLKRHGHVILDVCTPAGALERWTVPRSYGRVPYRDARKARWGDLWALGAKLRVPKRVRVGRSAADAEGDGAGDGVKATRDVKGRRVPIDKTVQQPHEPREPNTGAEARRREKTNKVREDKASGRQKTRERRERNPDLTALRRVIDSIHAEA